MSRVNFGATRSSQLRDTGWRSGGVGYITQWEGREGWVGYSQSGGVHFIESICNNGWVWDSVSVLLFFYTWDLSPSCCLWKWFCRQVKGKNTLYSTSAYEVDFLLDGIGTSLWIQLSTLRACIIEMTNPPQP